MPSEVVAVLYRGGLAESRHHGSRSGGGY